MNDHYNTFRYFVEHYMHDLNGGGTFTLIELIEEYKKIESPSLKEQLKTEAVFLKDTLQFESWEIDSILLKYLLKYNGLSRWKKIIDCLTENL